MVFPANRGTNTSSRGINDGQGGAITLSPDQALRAGGHQFAMLSRLLKYLPGDGDPSLLPR